MPVLHTSAINRPPTINRGATTTNQEQARERTRRGRRALVLWPWLLVTVAWAVLILATLAHQTFLLDHHTCCKPAACPGSQHWKSSALLAGDDGGDDAAIQYAHGQPGGVCRSQTSTARRGLPWRSWPAMP